jgi:hypothetical protein
MKQTEGLMEKNGTTVTEELTAPLWVCAQKQTISSNPGPHKPV